MQIYESGYTRGAPQDIDYKTLIVAQRARFVYSVGGATAYHVDHGGRKMMAVHGKGNRCFEKKPRRRTGGARALKLRDETGLCT